jgi:hypothetical protein
MARLSELFRPLGRDDLNRFLNAFGRNLVWKIEPDGRKWAMHPSVDYAARNTGPSTGVIELLKQEQSSLAAGTAVFIGVHSFLALAASITLGPLTSAAQPRQVSLAILFTATGALSALLQAIAGRNSSKRIRHLRAIVLTSSSPFIPAPDGCTPLPDGWNWEECMGMALPVLLDGFWFVFGAWLLWKW